MLFAIDIDDTICDSKLFVEALNRELDLHIDLSALKTYADFYTLPEVDAFFRNRKAEWDVSYERVSKALLESFLPIDGAVEGVRYLSQFGTIAYYTARQKGEYERTKRWLKRCAFPFADNVVCCRSSKQKLALLANYQPSYEKIVLIDDNTRIPAVLEQMKQDPAMARLLRRLTVLAFGQGHVSSVCSLAHWNDISLLIGK